ncbi:DUF3618 domain-containing protein [Streptomyces sp. HMX87]|uniref:DUF3618 domain-containing protein n=1 Tax=Streptomyces sp. HMX87 TaxID=3390849 RepID=UPI003A89FF40
MTDATSGDSTRSGSSAEPAAAGGAKGPDELRRQIEQTRSQLGDTVEELAGMADVKGRAKARAADLKDKAGALTVQLKSSAAHAGHTVQERAGRAGHAVQHRAGRAGHGGRHKAGRAGHGTVQHDAPGPVHSAVRAGRGSPRTLLVAGAAAGAVVAAGVLWRRRHGHH